MNVAAVQGAIREVGGATVGALVVGGLATAGGLSVHELIEHRNDRTSNPLPVLGLGAGAIVGGAAAGTGAFLGAGALIEAGSAALGRPYSSFSGLGLPAALGVAGVGGAILGWKLAND